MRLLLVVALLLCAFSTTAIAESKRVALIIANSHYEHAPDLLNPANDAKLITGILRTAGFAEQNITVRFDLGIGAMYAEIAAFSKRARGADVALLYFAGHGYGSALNYLIPVDAEMKSFADLPNEAISDRQLMAAVDTAQGLKLVILDACRNDPSQGRLAAGELTRSISRGLTEAKPPAGMLVAYSATHGTVAQDGPAGGNSPFATALASHLTSPIDIEWVFRHVRDDVLVATRGQQEPQKYGALPAKNVFLVSPPLEQPKAVVSVAPRAPLHDCDYLAADPGNPDSIFQGVAGIQLPDLDASKAIAACDIAVRQHPQEKRFRYQLARSQYKAIKCTEAISSFSALATEDYLPAIIELAAIYYSDCGGKNWKRAEQLLLKAESLGYEQARFSRATLYAQVAAALYENGDSKRALDFYRKAFSLDKLYAHLLRKGFPKQVEFPTDPAITSEIYNSSRSAFTADDVIEVFDGVDSSENDRIKAAKFAAGRLSFCNPSMVAKQRSVTYVKELQRLLAQQGLYQGPIDGTTRDGALSLPGRGVPCV